MVEVREALWRRRGGWWLKDRGLAVFMLREAGGVLSAVYGIVLLGLLAAYHGGPASFDAYLSLIWSPPILLLTLVVFAFVLVHAITWFFLIGRMQQVASKRPKRWQTVFVGNLVIFVLLSGAVLFLIFGWRFF